MTRGSSPVLLGRDADLDRLRAAIGSGRTASGTVVLVSGEAGIGKSRLLDELEATAQATPPGTLLARFLHATCIEVGERLAFLPVLDWLDDLRGDEPDAAAEAAALSVAFGGFDRDASSIEGTTEPHEMSRAARFTRLRDLLVGLARDRTVVAIIDDLHWADRSTLDVLTFLARQLSGTGVVVVAAFRSDELHRRHPLTAPLADLERHSVIDHIRLEPLDAVDVTRQIKAIEGGPGDPARIARVVALADGNPFHVEELLALDRPGPLPSSLRGVLTSRLGAVDDATMAVLREAAVIGRQVDAELLVAVSRDDRDRVVAALRAAMDARILMNAEDGRRVRFRHALLREAVYDDVLPSDRTDLHRRIALGLTERPDLGDPSPATASAELARHWLAAGARREAFIALLETAGSATAAAAWPEARWALEEALTLWGQLDDAEALAGRPRSELLIEAATDAWYEGDTRRSLELGRTAQTEPDVQADPLRLGLLLVREAWYQSDFGDMAAQRAAVERAVELIPADPPTHERVLAVSTLGLNLAGGGDVRDGIARLEEAQRLADELGDAAAATANLAFLSAHYAVLGQEERALATVAAARDALAVAEASGREIGDSRLAFFSNVPWVFVDLGLEATTEPEVEGYLAVVRRQGLEAGMGTWLAAPVLVAQFRLGRWDDALQWIEASSAYAPDIGPRCIFDSIRARILAARGSVVASRESAARAVEAARTGWADEWHEVQAASAWTELLAGDPRGAALAIEAAIDGLPIHEPTTWRAELAWLAAWDVADHAGRDRGDLPVDARVERLAAFARTVIDDPDLADDVAARAGRLGGLERWKRLAVLELERATGRDDPGGWSALADELEAMEGRTLALIARLREAAARLSRGDDRASVEVALRSALGHADAMGATLFRDQARDLARLGRIRLDDEDAAASAAPAQAQASVPDSWGLSAREREVLALVIDGRTNAQIGEALYISDKTASVHVTHILDKLGVDSRVEAALLAVRAGFVPPTGAED